MKCHRYKLGRTAAAVLLAAVVTAGTWLVRSPAKADEATQPAGQDTIHITADSLVTDNNARIAEFSGNVKAVQGNTEVNADKLILHYRGGQTENKEKGSDNIEKIEALGHVRIVFDNRVAVSEQAVYTTVDRRLVLTGKGSKITSDRNVITGNKIVLDRNNGRMEILGNEEKQVEAILHSDQRGLN